MCGEKVEVPKSIAAKAMRSGRKEITSEQAKKMVATREANRKSK